MKLIKLADHGPFKTTEILKAVLGGDPRGITLEQMRKRIAILDRLEAAAGAGQAHVVLKNDQFELLAEALKSYPFTLSHKDLLALLEEVLASDEPPAVAALVAAVS